MLEFTRVSDNLKQPRELLKDVDGEPVPRQHVYIYRLAQKVRHHNKNYHKIVFKTVNEARFFINFDYKMRTRILHMFKFYTLCD